MIMKKLTFAVVILMLIASLFGCGANKKLVFEDIRYFSFTYQVGNYDDGFKNFTLKYADGRYTASVKPPHVADENRISIEVDEAFVRELEAILTEHSVNKWNGFNKANKNVLDGNMFTLSITCGNTDEYDENKRLSAHGYEKWPDGYKEVRDAVEDLFMKSVPVAGE